MSIKTPDWVKHAVFYQIFPDRFSRIVPEHQCWLLEVPVEPWDAPPTLQGYKGGNLWGVIEQLDYLSDLGIDAIYLNPIFSSASNHRYHTLDYYTVEPLLGGDGAFEQLLAAVHARGMKLILDGTFNHASRGFSFFNDILENGPHSPWVDWFKLKDWPLAPYDGDRPANYVSWHDNRALPEFNHSNPAVREYLMQVAEYWIRRGADGWRLDSADYIQVPGFWQEFRQRVKAINPDAYLVGEVPMELEPWLDGTQFDGASSLPLLIAITAFVVGDRQVQGHFAEYSPPTPITAAGYGEQIDRLLQRFPWEIQLAQLNGLNNHDTARLLTVAGGDLSSLALATLLLLTFPGAPCIYYGDEVALPGDYDPDCRRAFPPAAAWNHDILDLHRRLIGLRRAHPALRVGQYQPLMAYGSVYGLARTWDDDEVIIVLNVGDQPEVFDLPLAAVRPPTQTALTYGSGQVQGTTAAAQPTLAVELGSRSAMILT